MTEICGDLDLLSCRLGNRHSIDIACNSSMFICPVFQHMKRDCIVDCKHFFPIRTCPDPGGQLISVPARFGPYQDIFERIEQNLNIMSNKYPIVPISSNMIFVRTFGIQWGSGSRKPMNYGSAHEKTQNCCKKSFVWLLRKFCIFCIMRVP